MGEIDLREAPRSAEPRGRDADAPHEIGPLDGPLIALVDFGLKQNIVRQLVARGARVRVLPHTVDARAALAPDVRGIVFSPGPGDPAGLDGPVRLAQAAIEDGRPLLGICLGHQIVGRAAGVGVRLMGCESGTCGVG